MSMINLNGRLRINVIGYTGYINTLNNIMTFVMIDLHHSWRDWKEKGELMVRRSSSSDVKKISAGSIILSYASCAWQSDKLEAIPGS